jgi:parallel beta-helix repeat protein
MPKHRRPRRPRQLSRIEVLEGRALLSTFTVTDPGDAAVGFTLRAAILAVDVSGGPTTIAFNLPAGMLTIKPATPLPTVTKPVTIDGTTQTGFTSAPIVVIDGATAPATANGLSLNSTGVVIKSLVIDNFGGSGVLIQGTGGDEVLSSYVGVAADGLTAASNGHNGILISGASNNTVGGNLLSGNSASGLEIDGPSTANLITGCFIGVGQDGLTAVPNGASGVFLNASSGNTVGGTASGTANVISGNNVSGIVIDGSGNLVEGSFIGVASDGLTPVGNGAAGIQINSVNNNTIGGTAAGSGNVISGNKADGVDIIGSPALNATGNVIEGCDIGVASDGLKGVGNAGDGVLITLASGNTVGGSASGSQNIISGNGNAQVELAASGNVVAGSFIGLGADGMSTVTGTISGSHLGILISGSANTIGGATAASGNLISGNDFGISLVGPGADFNVIEQNDIGTDVSTTIKVGNNLGIRGQGETNTTILNNVISGNAIGGLFLTDGGFNFLSGNLIGTDQTGLSPVGNGGYGIELVAETGDVIGAASPAKGNVISANKGTGLVIVASNLVSVVDNIIGLGGSGLVTAKATGNGLDGIDISGTTRNTTIGGLTSGSGNLITSNGGSGIFIQSPASVTTVEGNLVGTDSTGAAGPGNGKYGVWANGAPVILVRNVISQNLGAAGVLLQQESGSTVQGNLIGNFAGKGNAGIGLWLFNASGNTIGGTSPSTVNIISGNVTFGISVSNGSSGNLIEGNWIGLNSTAGVGQGNATGIGVSDSPGTTIGGTAAGASNLIGGNSLYGISVTGALSTGTQIVSNIVGLTANATTVDANGAGIGLFGAIGVLIQQNILSANTSDGVLIVNGSGDVIVGNLIGTDGSGTLARPNGHAGVQNSGASGTVIGGLTAAARNVISGNAFLGVQVDGAGSTGVVIEGNYIGVDVTGAKTLGNTVEGVFVASPGVLIGGSMASGRNVIGGSGFYGVHLAAGSSGSTVAGNFIGLDATGLHAAADAVTGVFLDGATGVLVGGPVAGWANFITGSGTADVELANGATGNLVEGNFIGTDATGLNALSAAPFGIAILSAPANTIGGTVAFTANELLGHSIAAILISGASSSGNLVVGNLIGPGNIGSSNKANFYSVYISGAPNNTIGGTAKGHANIIRGNKFNQILVFGASGNQTSGNVIGPNF